MELLVLKGGNALQIVYDIGNRASVDIDYSVEGDILDRERLASRIEQAVTAGLLEVGLVVFDFRFESRPRGDDAQEWGGYDVEFKLIPSEKFDRLGGELLQIRKQAEMTGDGERRKFKIQISKYENTAGSDEVVVDNYIVRAYTPLMIAGEKLRALCQQHPDYDLRGYRTTRARDVYDIYSIVEETGLDLTDAIHRELLQAIFQAKKVDISLLGRLAEQRSFHENDWESVIVSVSGPIMDFDFYFDFVCDLGSRLEAAWNV